MKFSPQQRLGHMSIYHVPLNAATASATVGMADINIGPGNFWFGREMELNRIGIRARSTGLLVCMFTAWLLCTPSVLKYKIF
jgi:hypothetical protein